MKKIVQALIVLACVTVLSGCGTFGKKKNMSPSLTGGVAGNMTEVRSDRMLIWKAHLGIEVWSVSNAVSEAVAVAERQGGFIERKSDSGDRSACLSLRIPAKAFRTAVARLETLGTVTYRSIEGEDVTGQYIDVEARLKNKIVLRDRLKQLLEKAAGVKDILSIETELNRVQADIDSMEGRIKSLRGQVDYATVTLNLERKQILGPLGYLCKGLWWGVEKMFILRD